MVTGRYSSVPRGERICENCSLGQIGDEFHYLFQCPLFENSRKQALKKYFWKHPNVLKMESLFNNTSKESLVKLAKFCQEIVKYFDK